MSRRPLQLADMARVLELSVGITGTARTPDGVELPLRATPSAGGLCSYDLFVLARHVEGLTPGVHYVHPGRRVLQLVADDCPFEDVAAHTGYAGRVGEAAAVVVFVAAFRRGRWKYGERGYRMALIECGHVAQSVVTAAAALGLVAHPLAGFVDDYFDRLVGVNGTDDAVVHLTLLGRPKHDQGRQRHPARSRCPAAPPGRPQWLRGSTRWRAPAARQRPAAARRPPAAPARRACQGRRHRRGPLPEVPRTRVLELLEGLREQRIVEYARGDRPPGTGSVAVLGPTELTCDLVAVLGRTRVAVHDLGDPAQPPSCAADLLITATASVFDPGAAAVNERCVREDLPCLFFGLLPGGAAFAGPLWSPGRTVACYACLRTRIFSNSVHGPVWSAYTASLAASGTPALDRRVPPWTAARLAGAVARRATAWLERRDDDPPGELLWLDEDGGETTRFVLPVPTCPVCGGRENAGTEAAAPLTAAVDDKVGAVHTVSVRRAESGPAIYLAGSTSPTCRCCARTWAWSATGAPGSPRRRP